MKYLLIIGVLFLSGCGMWQAYSGKVTTPDGNWEREGGENVLPDRIIIYRGPIERLCKNENEIKEKVLHHL